MITEEKKEERGRKKGKGRDSEMSRGSRGRTTASASSKAGERQGTQEAPIRTGCRLFSGVAVGEMLGARKKYGLGVLRDPATPALLSLNSASLKPLSRSSYDCPGEKRESRLRPSNHLTRQGAKK